MLQSATTFIGKNRINLARIIALIFFTIGIRMSFNLWHSDRLFPLCPVIDGFPVLPESIDQFMPILLISGLLASIFVKNRQHNIGMLAMLLFLFLQDQMRWQPWAYLYVCMILPFALFKEPKKELLGYFQILMIGVYLWSGIHKIHPGFIETTFNKMLEELFLIENQATIRSLNWLGYSIPIIEILIAIFLFFRKTRTIGVIGAVSTHVIILIYLIKIEHNIIVYPWNLAMILFTIALFWKSDYQLSFKRIKETKVKMLTSMAVLFFIVMPSLNFVGSWDNYLSFKLYTGTNGIYCIGLNQDQYQKVDEELYDCFWKVDEPNGKYWIYVNKWAFDELNVAFYSEMRVFKKVSKSFCDGDIPSEKLEFVKFNDGFSRKGAEVFHCEDCEAERLKD